MLRFQNQNRCDALVATTSVLLTVEQKSTVVMRWWQPNQYFKQQHKVLKKDY